MSKTPATDWPPKSAIARAIVLVAVWLPVLTALVWFIPKFHPIFSKLDEKGELPVLTYYVYWASILIRLTWGIPALIAFAILILTDICIRRKLHHLTVGRTLYRAWFGVVTADAAIVFVLSLAALLLPVCKMSAC